MQVVSRAGVACHPFLEDLLVMSAISVPSGRIAAARSLRVWTMKELLLDSKWVLGASVLHFKHR